MQASTEDIVKLDINKRKTELVLFTRKYKMDDLESYLAAISVVLEKKMQSTSAGVLYKNWIVDVHIDITEPADYIRISYLL